MAGKSNKGRNRKASQTQTSNNSAEPVVTSDANPSDAIPSDANPKAALEQSSNVDSNGDSAPSEIVDAKLDVKEPETSNDDGQSKQGQGDIQLYAVSVKTQNGEKLELQLSPGDTVMDVRQFLLDAPETCFFTSYDLLLHTKDGSTHHLEDYNEISDVGDITTGGCSLEMVAALYDDRSIRSHVHRTRDLLSLSNIHASLSTSLARQYEMTQNKAPNSGDTAKTDIQEIDGLDVMEDVSGSLGKLLSFSYEDIKCVESIVFSSFNPPPSYRRLVGDLIYLDVVTLEGSTFCVTGTTKTFYVNSSMASILDPRPTKSNFEAPTLIGLLQKISFKFKKAFRDILEKKAKAHPFENVQSLLPPNSWLGSYPIPDHKRDAARAEDAVTLSFGSELIGMQRDWNEELQSCREFPHTNLQETILRDRALYKVTSDFVDAAVSGAVGVINRCIPPINPTDPECFHIFAVDGDVEQLSKKRSSDVNSNVGSVPNNTPEKVSNDISKVDSNGEQSDGLSNGVVEDLGQVGSETPPLAESEQATYASANNDLKGTKAYQEADVPGLYNLAMAIIDYRGHRVIAQSVLPGILQGDKSDSLLYGSVDNGKKISWNENFNSKMAEAAKRLHLKEHTVLDGSGKEFKLSAPVECKGIVGSDDRHYVLDLMRVTPRDANYIGAGSRFCILRQELINAFCQAEATESSKSKSGSEAHDNNESSKLGIEKPKETEASTDATQNDSQEKNEVAGGSEFTPAEITKSHEEIFFNPNVFTEFKLAGSTEEIAVDEENVKKVSSYLVDVVLPKFVQDLCTLEVSPMDGQTLTEALHAHGINVRYIGKVAEGTKHFPHLWDLCSNEIAVRCAKHFLKKQLTNLLSFIEKDVLRDTEDHDVGPAIAHFLNCFFGKSQAITIKANTSSPHSRTPKKDQTGQHSSGKLSRGQSRLKGRASSKKNQSSYMNISSDTLWSDVQEFAKLKYQFEVPEDAQERVKKVSVLRNLCQKGMLSEAYTLFSEAFAILQQVTGPLHREVANCCRYLAMVLYHAGDMPGAIMQQHKELIINERCLGLDHPDTAHSYGNMALFYHGVNQPPLALQHMARALLLLSLSSGPDHPDVAATFINVAMMYQDIGKMNVALRYLQEALKKNERLLGEEHIQTAVCYHALAIAFNCIGAYKLSHQHEKKTYDILVKQLGEEDSRTKDSLNWLNTFKMREVQMNAHKQKNQAMDAASTQKAIEILKANPDLMHAFQAAAAAGGSGSSTVPANKSLNSAIIGESLNRGRGYDERAARAATEMRKKAAAKGLLTRPQGVPVQPVPALSQLLNIINSGTTPEATNSSGTEEMKIEANSQPSSDPDVSKKNQPSGQDDKAPAGLGKGLAPKHQKKSKAKA
ncbi:hypothetical protein ACFE04_001146 [Oxalis oulophora]